MADLGEKYVNLETLRLIYGKLKAAFRIPHYSEEDEGKVLGVKGGRIQWVELKSGVLIDGDTVGDINTSSDITLSDIDAGTYTLYYEDENNEKLEGWKPIGKVEVV